MPIPVRHTSHEVVVSGGGCAGTLAANRLRVRDDVETTLVNPRPTFVDRIRPHQFAAGTGEVAVDYGTLLAEEVRLVVDSATRIDTATRTVRLASGGALDHDYVVYAVGSTTAVPSSVPGAAGFAVPIGELESAQRLRGEPAELRPGAPVTVVGGGLTGIGTAAEPAERGHRVTLVAGGTLAPSLSAPGRRYTAKWLSRHGVAVIEADAVAEVRPDAVVLADGTVLASADHLDGGFRRAGLGGRERAAHRRARPAAHRRDSDQSRRRPDRRGR